VKDKSALLKVSKSAKVVNTPEKGNFINRENELKTDRCEMLDSSGGESGGEQSTLWKGRVQQSVTGEGVSVTFTDVEQLERRKVTEFIPPRHNQIQI